MPRGMDIGEVYDRALGPGATPFEFQKSIAHSGFPDVLDVPTGCGKTPAMLLGWLFRKLLHPDEAVRDCTPTRLIWCMPLRTLTNQTAQLARDWVNRLDLADQVDVHLLMGGETVTDDKWRMSPGRPTVILATLDMALSRALNRGYLSSRFSWPIDFALFNSDCHWVFDEVQLMGVALSTSRQIHGLRDVLGTAKPHGSTWMSATVAPSDLLTVDAPDLGRVLELGNSDRNSERLLKRLRAPKLLITREVDDPKKYGSGFAEIVRGEHRPGVLTLAVVNTVTTARDVAANLRRQLSAEADPPQVVLVHSRFRPEDRQLAIDRLLDTPPAPGLIVVSTQVVEAGVDVSATSLVTECAPWSSIVQRAGRCNRTGVELDPRLVIVRHAKPGPYESDEVDAAWNAAVKLDGQIATPESLAALEVSESRRPHSILRRPDLLGLFDTAPDLFGNDIDVSRFIRIDQNIDLALVWRDFDLSNPSSIGSAPSRTEICPVPISDARDFLKKPISNGRAFVEDVLQPVRKSSMSGAIWRKATDDDIRPGVTIVLHSDDGGYSPDFGFDPKKKEAVPPLPVDSNAAASAIDADRGVDDDAGTTNFGAGLELVAHLLDVESEAIVVCAEITGIDDLTVRTIARAGRLHDLGKSHEVFQGALHAALDPPVEGVLAKSGNRRRLRYEDPSRRGFRHEFASALALMAHPELVGDADLDASLVTYLVGAHHGRLRVGVRSLPDEPENQVLGVRQGDVLPAVDLGKGLHCPSTELDLYPTLLGGTDGRESWTAMALDLLASYGPFRLAWLEMLVRIADWRASASLAGLSSPAGATENVANTGEAAVS